MRIAGIVLSGLALLLPPLARAQEHRIPTETKLSHYELLNAKEKRFNEYARSFLSFAQSNAASSVEYETATDLYTVASETETELHATNTLLSIYNNISCKKDRTIIQIAIALDLFGYSKLIENSIEKANLDIGHTQKPGVAAEGIHMRDDLHETKNLLDSVRLQ